SGCSGFEDIRLVGVKDVTYREFKGNVLRLAITVTVDNPNRFGIKLKNANMDLRLNDRVIGTVMQMEQVELAARTQKDYKVQVSIEMKDMLTNLISLYRVLMNEPENLNFSGSIQVKSFLYSKTFQIDRLSFQ
ncbi:MAG: LEA type 2 family protein, partial [Bacteroidales bacterium]|nr:LEA type 2 family protein [Bacteroidales bacterium]